MDWQLLNANSSSCGKSIFNLVGLSPEEFPKFPESAKNLNKIKLQRVFINNCSKNIVSEQGGVANDDLEFYYAAKVFANIYSNASSEELFVAASNLRTPDFRIKIDGVH